ncbi:MAG: UDP-N-acetylmuramate dehydrogenase [Candidatus Omnitrophota bacterium]
MNWPKSCAIKVNYPLREQTTFRIGGKARFFCEPRGEAELASLMRSAGKNRLPVFVMGAGSNLLVSDKGVKGLVIRLRSPHFKKIALERGCIRAGSGALLAQLIKFSIDRSLGGLEFLVGIPGTLGGALAMNAGCWESSIGELVKEVRVMDRSGKIRLISAREIGFAYRSSGLEKYIILGALLKAQKGRRQQAESKAAAYLGFRLKNQDLTRPNAGCIFRNPPQRYAGKMIDSCGLKGRRIGGAFISERHANFIMNSGKARSQDVLDLMRLMQNKVRKNFRVTLQPEIKIWE